MKEEDNRVTLYLHGTTKDPLLKKCVQVLVTKHLELLTQEFQNLLNSEKNDDLGRMYDLVNRSGTSNLNELRQTLEQYVGSQGLQALEKIVDQALQVKFE